MNDQNLNTPKLLEKAEHSGFKEGETVLIEGTIISSADHVSTVAIRHLTDMPGEAIMVSNKLLFRKGCTQNTTHLNT